IAFQIIPLLLLAVVVNLMPESPRWLIKVGRRVDAEYILTRLRVDPVAARREADEIEAVVQLEKGGQVDGKESVGDNSYVGMFLGRGRPGSHIARRVQLVIWLQIVQEWVGIAAVTVYAPRIFSGQGIAMFLAGGFSRLTFDAAGTSKQAQYGGAAAFFVFLYTCVVGWSIGNGWLTLLTPVMFNAINEKTLYVFGACNVLAIPFVWAFYPETNQRTLEEMDLLFSADSIFAWEAEKAFAKLQAEHPEVVHQAHTHEVPQVAESVVDQDSMEEYHNVLFIMESLRNIRVGHPASGVDHTKMAKRIAEKRAGCDLYTAPAAGATINSLEGSFTMTWNPSCATNAPSAVDIYLTAANTNTKGAIHVWQKVNFAAGTYTDVLKPKWWNATSDVSLQLSFVAASTPLFLSNFPVGPTWTAHYDASSPREPRLQPTLPLPMPSTRPSTIISTAAAEQGRTRFCRHLPYSHGRCALLVYVKFSRKKEAKKRQRWSQAMDKRMSTISKDWAGARPSMAGSRNTRASSWYVTHMGNQAGRPSSTFANESGQAGIGARYGGPNSPGAHSSSIGSGPEMGQIRPRALSSLTPSDRISRISFAGDSRPSMGDSMRPAISHGTPTRAFHSATLASDDIEMSPTQASGPYSLSADEIRAKVAQGHEHGTPSVDGDLRDDILQMPAATRRTPAPVHNAMFPTGAMPMAPSHASPDDMMRAYAQARTNGTNTPSQGMRTLYAPANADGLSPAATHGAEDKNPYRKSMNSEASRYSEADVGRAA
ncbi:Permeases of the major facilitator superfamily, partial [Rhizoctonia solani]